MKEIYEAILKTLEAGERAALATVIGTKGSTPGKETAKMLIREDGTTIGSIGGGCTEADVWALARQVLLDDRPLRHSFKLTAETAAETGLLCGGILEIYIEPIGSPVITIFGAGHLGVALAQVADISGFPVVVVDDRAEFANRERFPTARDVVVGEFDRVFEHLRINASSYLVVVTRGHQYDEKVLEQALKTDAGYIGLIGSKVKIRGIFRNLEERGTPPSVFSRVRAPIGLDIGARTPAEIAVSIVAQLIAERRRPFIRGGDESRLPGSRGNWAHPGAISPEEAHKAPPPDHSRSKS